MTDERMDLLGALEESIDRARLQRRLKHSDKPYDQDADPTPAALELIVWAEQVERKAARAAASASLGKIAEARRLLANAGRDILNALEDDIKNIDNGKGK